VEAVLATPAVEDEVPGYQPDLSRLRRMFDDARNSNSEARRESETDRDYYDGHQLTAGERAKLRQRKQPEIIINRVRPGIAGVIGMVEQSKTDPRAFARNPAGERSATVASETLRYVADTSHFDQTKMEALENYLVEGTCAVLIEGAPDADVTVTQIRWEEFFADPRSRRNDFSDARYLGAAKWMYADDLAAIYPEFNDDITDFLREGSMGSLNGLIGGDGFEDRPENVTPWISRQQRRLMVVEMYFREGGEWMRAVFYAGQALEAGPSPYTDEDGKPTCPIVAESCFVDRQNRRYGMVRDMRGPQDEINMRRSRLLHLANSRQLQPIDGNTNPTDADEARRQAAMPDGVVPLGYQIVPTQDMTAGNVNLLQEAKGEIERMGPNPAILGRQGSDASGRAVLARQQAGMVELARVLGRHADWELRCYKQMWARAKQFWTAPKWIRITDDIGTPQYVQINDPTPQPGPNGEPGAPVVDFQTGQPVPQQNHIAKMDVDIIVDTVQDTATIAQEQFTEIVRLISSVPGMAQLFPPEVILKASSLTNKKELIDDLMKAKQEQAQQAAQQQQIQQAGVQADLMKTHSEVAKNEATARFTEARAIQTAAGAHMSIDQHLSPPPGPTGDVGPQYP
jgi:hypothetical protein